jgi:hypothetical protein
MRRFLSFQRFQAVYKSNAATVRFWACIKEDKLFRHQDSTSS